VTLGSPDEMRYSERRTYDERTTRAFDRDSDY